MGGGSIELGSGAVQLGVRAIGLRVRLGVVGCHGRMLQVRARDP